MEEKHACFEARNWVGNRTPARAWRECERADWMSWALGQTPVDRRLLVQVACDIALSVMHLNPDPRVAACIDTVERWIAGEATLKEVRSARIGARDAAYNVSAADAAASYDAAAYNVSAAWAVSRTEALKMIADLIRTRISPAMFARLVGAK